PPPPPPRSTLFPFTTLFRSLHTSVVQALPSSVHAVPTALTASAGQVVLVPVQVSARSHSLTAARHTAPAFPTGCVQAGESRVPLDRKSTRLNSSHVAISYAV